jgi:sugar O-acyltransferase (sialic acid O-acetyltransferase NeuD family)
MIVGIIGFGSFGKQIKNFLEHEYLNTEYLFFDDTITGSNIHSFKDYHKFSSSKLVDKFYVGLGYKNLIYKYKVIDNIPSYQLPYYIHHSVNFSKANIIGCGTIVFPNVVLDSNVHIGRGVVLNISSVVCHDSEIGDCCFIAPSVTICGNVKVGNCCFIGAGSIITNGITIGDNVTIGAGTIVTKNINSNDSIIGNPMRKVKKINLY